MTIHIPTFIVGAAAHAAVTLAMVGLIVVVFRVFWAR